jgi:nucleolar protein 56
MRSYIVTTFIGCFGVEGNKIISFRPFPKDTEKIAEKLKLSEIEIINEEKELQKELLSKGYTEIFFSTKKPGVKNIELGNKSEQYVKENLRKLALDYKFVKDQIEFNQLLTQVNINLTKEKIKKSVEKDSLVIQINGAIEELDKSINIFIERLRELYSLHFPEMDRIISDHEKYATLIEKYGSREKIEDPTLKQFVEKSMGIDLTEEDIKAIQSFSKNILELYELRKNLSKYLEKLLKEIAPNFSELAGSAIAAKLISKAGGIEKLARMPSSVIQLLGSEKALFRFLHAKRRVRGPKYGLIYNHPLIQNSPQHKRGKIARVLASKLSIAIKLDYYSKEYKGPKMKEELQQKVKDILSSQ